MHTSVALAVQWGLRVSTRARGTRHRSSARTSHMILSRRWCAAAMRARRKKCKDTNSKYEQNVAVDLDYYTVHCETTHGKEQYFNNPDSLKCHNCELGFTSRAVFARHLTRALKQVRGKDDHIPTINRLIFPHIEKL